MLTIPKEKEIEIWLTAIKILSKKTILDYNERGNVGKDEAKKYFYAIGLQADALVEEARKRFGAELYSQTTEKFH